MLSYIFTVKQLAGPLKIYVDTKETLEEIFSCLVTKYIHGSAGLMRLYNLKTLRESYVLDTGTSIRNIDDFIRTKGVVQQLNIIDNATDVLVSTIAYCIFLQEDLQNGVNIV